FRAGPPFHPCGRGPEGLRTFRLAWATLPARIGHRDRPEYGLDGARPRGLAVVPPATIRATTSALEIIIYLLGSDAVLYRAQKRFAFRQAQSQVFHPYLPPFHLHHIVLLFSTLIIYANHFHPEFHARYLPRSISFASRWLASFKLKRFGSKGPY